MTQHSASQPSRAEQAYHFSVVRRAIDIIDASETPPTLEQIAARMDMSAAHFQRVFSRWAGVSPKRFAQYLALGHAKALLRERFTTLETAQAVGLSGSGRLHDLFLRWEAMSPGDFARQGAGLVIRWGQFDSPFGPCVVAGTEAGICGLAFSAETGTGHALDDLKARWPQADYHHDPDALAPWAGQVFSDTRQDRPDTPLVLIGAPFQIKVWEALMRIPSGQVTTYSEIARAIGSPRAVRAVGTAVGRNPIGWLIPCHRALRKSGGLGGYHWGLPVKRAMLAYEAANFSAQASGQQLAEW